MKSSWGGGPQGPESLLPSLPHLRGGSGLGCLFGVCESDGPERVTETPHSTYCCSHISGKCAAVKLEYFSQFCDDSV